LQRWTSQGLKRKERVCVHSASPPAPHVLPHLLVSIPNNRTPPVLTSCTRTPLCPSGFILPVIFLPSVQTLHHPLPCLPSASRAAWPLLYTSALQIWVLDPEKQFFWVFLSTCCILINLCHGARSVSAPLLSPLSCCPPNSTPVKGQSPSPATAQPQDTATSAWLHPKMGCESAGCGKALFASLLPAFFC